MRFRMTFWYKEVGTKAVPLLYHVHTQLMKARVDAIHAMRKEVDMQQPYCSVSTNDSTVRRTPLLLKVI